MYISDKLVQQDPEIQYYSYFFESRLKIVFGDHSNKSDLRSGRTFRAEYILLQTYSLAPREERICLFRMLENGVLRRILSLIETKQMEDGNKRHSEGFRNVHSQQEEDEWG
jgi:hypothetical protein